MKLHARLMLPGLILAVFAMSLPVFAQEIEIQNGDIQMKAGESVTLQVVYEDEAGVQHDTTATWSVDPANLGDISGNVFTARKHGEGKITAVLGEHQDEVDIEIEKKDNGGGGDHYPRLEILPGKIKIEPGDTTHLRVVFKADENSMVDTTATLTVDPPELAEIDTLYVLTALLEGEGEVKAVLGEYEAEAELEIEVKDGEEQDSSSANLKIFTKKMDLEVGETVQLEARFITVDGDTQNAAIQWYVSPGYLGTIDGDWVFTAGHPGKGHIIARADTFEARVRLKIEGEDDENGTGQPRIKLLTERLKVHEGDSLQLAAIYLDAEGEEVDTTIVWSVDPAGLGHFSDTVNGLFYAETEGKGYVRASVGALYAAAEIKVQAPQEEEHQYGRLVIVPQDTSVIVGAVVDYKAQWLFEGVLTDTTVDEWELHGAEVGELDETSGLLTTTATGAAFIKAEMGDEQATAQITVTDAEGNIPDVNEVAFSRVLPDGHVLPPQIIREGQAYRIGGLPSPLNILNEGLIYFPAGSLTEDITIHMLLPDNAQVGDSTVAFTDSSIAAVRFMVMVGDSVAEPYYFGVPLQVAIPYDPEMLDQLGITAEDLGMFFANGSGEYLDDGLTGITVDSTAGKIYAQVAHFSTLVIRSKSKTTTSVDIDRQDSAPKTFSLHQNYPNPFNPATGIGFNIKESAQVKIKIYDAAGRELTTLFNDTVRPGSYQRQWVAEDMPSGVYFYSLYINGKRSATRKMLLIK